MNNEDIEQRLNTLSDLVDSLARQDKTRSQIDQYDDAELRTNKFILFQIAVRLGSDYERFTAHYEAVHRRQLALKLDEVSRVSQNLAGELDVRSLDAVDTDDDLPRLFPD